MIVDAYTLVGGLTVRPEPMGFAELFGQMTKAGVGRAAVTSLRGLNADARKGNDHLFSGAASDERLIPVGVVGPKVSADAAHDILEAMVKPGEVFAFHVYLITHGRRVCKAQRPQCQSCVLAWGCPSRDGFMKAVSGERVPSP